MQLRKGQEITLDVERLALEGRGVAHLDDLVVFVDKALAGERVRARVRRVKRRYAEARTVEILQAAPDRIEPRCIHVGECGGCTWQGLDYTRQLDVKAALVRETLQHIGGFQDLEVPRALASPDPFHYRNKMEYSFFVGRDGSTVLGLHTPGRFDHVFDLSACHLMSETSNAIVHRVRQLAHDSGLPAYHSKRHEGFWRYLVIREGKNTGQTMVNLVTTDAPLPGEETFVKALLQECPTITSVVRNINTRKATIAVGEREESLHGNPWIEEVLDGLHFRISANSFFQTNPRQAERLFSLAIQAAELQPQDNVLDLYCGTGTISLFAARRARQVTGIEIVDEAVRGAEQNAALNGIDNCRFLSGEVRDFFRKRVAEASSADVVFTDPPRAGLHPDIVQALRLLQPPRIVYVSCNPSTLARDLEMLCRDDVYAIRSVQPVDMFPHTYHIETVVRLDRVRPGHPEA
jgi:23S rRNA (uracil1939-C5)-methyltransferase